MSAPTRTVTIPANDPFAPAARFLVHWFRAKGNFHAAAEEAAELSRSMPICEHTFRQFIQKGAVTAQAISASDPYSIGAIFFSLLQSASILGRLAPRFRRIPFRVKVPADTGAGGTFGWKGEGLAAPLTKSVTATITQEIFTAAYTVLISNEAFRFGKVAEPMLSDEVVTGLARGVDGQLLDPTVAATSKNPASITKGTPTITSAGTTAANLVTDLSALLAQTTSALTDPVLVMQTRTFYAGNAKLAGAGYSTAPDSWLGIPVIHGNTSPRQIALIDCANIAYSADDSMAIDLSTEGAVEMDGAPSSSGITATGASMVSLFQSGLVGIKAELPVCWQPIHFNGGSPTVPSGVATVAVTY